MSWQEKPGFLVRLASGLIAAVFAAFIGWALVGAVSLFADHLFVYVLLGTIIVGFVWAFVDCDRAVKTLANWFRDSE